MNIRMGSADSVAAGPTAYDMLSRVARFARIADGVYRLSTVFVNCYAVEIADDIHGNAWVLIDTGVPTMSAYVQVAVHRQFGTTKPKAIVLTHGHFDHAGNAKALATIWDVPIYAARLELPYLTGQSDYPPQDPTPGGAICFLSRFFPRGAVELGPHLRQMPEEQIPEMPGWRIIATPGHTVGHISLFRESDRLLLSGDALATTDLDSWQAQLNWPRKLSRPPTPFTPDWPAAYASIRRLAELSPKIVAPGHGLAIMTDDLPDQLRAFSESVQAPHDSRYTTASPEFDETGALLRVPPAVSDPIGRQWFLGLFAAVSVVVAAYIIRWRKKAS